MKIDNERDAIEAIEKGWLTLYYVPASLQTAKVCLAAVKRKGNDLRHVPYALRTAKVCRAAVEQDGWALEYVPASMKTAKVCLAGVRQAGRALDYVPKSRRTAKVFLAAVEQDWWVLYSVPKSRRTVKVCQAAARQDRRALRFVPDASLTVGMMTGDDDDERLLLDACGDMVLTRDDAIEAEVCEDGLDEWLDEYAFGGRVTLATALKTGAERGWVLKVAKQAIESGRQPSYFQFDLLGFDGGEQALCAGRQK